VVASTHLVDSVLTALTWKAELVGCAGARLPQVSAPPKVGLPLDVWQPARRGGCCPSVCDIKLACHTAVPGAGQLQSRHGTWGEVS